MSTQVGIFPKLNETHAHIWIGAAADRMRVVRIADATIHVPSRGVLDALQAALDEIRADMDREEAADAGNELAAS